MHSSMKIIYDARWILVANRFDGVSRYSLELAKELAKRDDLDITWLIYDERQLAKLPSRPAIYANNPNDGFRELFLARTLNKAGADAVYSPFFVMGTLGKRYKLVLTIHDMIYFTHRTPPQWLPWHVRLGWRLFHLTYWPMRWQLNRADTVATVSDTARQELLDAHATKRAIVTVANAVSNDFKDTVKRDHSAMDGVVYMGAFTPYKNVECVIDAVALVPDVTLHLCGKLPPARRPAIEARIAEHDIANRVVIYDGTTDEEYKEALAQARCAISASRLEGFGLPVLEAQQFGVPFVAADTPIFREVGQESMLFFDPDSPEQAAKHIRSLADKATNQKYVTLGHENATRYSWTHSANKAAEMMNAITQKS
jgi:glycosyltransferase involved in cell wall biosynthesis